MVRGPGGNGIGLAARGFNRLERVLPRVADSNVKASSVDTQITAHDAAELDVAHDFVARVVPLDPMLLHGDYIEAEVARDAGDGARVVRLDAADRDERVAALRQRVGRQVLQLAHLVA